MHRHTKDKQINNNMCLIERDKYVWCLPKEQLPYMFKIDSVKQIKNILLAETDMF